jgi:putative phage-type endonuclease
MSALALNILDCEQRTPEWIEARIGKVTGSSIAAVLAEIKKGESATRRNYRAEIIVEILTGLPADTYVSKEMQWGAEQEPFARAAYEIHQDVMVTTVGFATHPEISRFGASPDGLVGDDGLVEIKCPNTATHLEYLLAGVVPSEYEPQMLTAMACTGRQWCDFVSFDPRMPAHLQLFVKRFARDNERIAEIETKVVSFLYEVDDVLRRLHPAESEF